MRYYVVSDVHGFYVELIKALGEKGYFSDTTPHKLIICGDFFDRGDQAKEMEKFLVNLINKKEVILIKGNHEDLVEEFVYNIDKYFLNMEESHHFRNSTVDTCCQLTDIPLPKVYEDKEDFVNKMKDTEFFKTIIPSCLNYYETKHYIFVHGFIPCFADGYARDGGFTYDPTWREVTDKQRWIYARWYNGQRAVNEGVKEEGKTIVVGHWHCSYGHAIIEGNGVEHGDTAVYTPYYNDGIIAIDACVPRSHFINCIVIDDEEL